MKQYNVFKGTYPFNEYMATVEADSPEEALALALDKVDHTAEDPGMRHPVVEEANGHTLH